MPPTLTTGPIPIKPALIITAQPTHKNMCNNLLLFLSLYKINVQNICVEFLKINKLEIQVDRSTRGKTSGHDLVSNTCEICLLSWC